MKLAQIVCALVLAWPSAGAALVVHDEGKTQLAAHALARYEFEAVNTDETRIGSNLSFARLGLSGKYDGVGESAVVWDAERRDLLDAWVELKTRSPVGLRVGRFRTPFSADWQTGLGNIATARRPALAGRALARATGLNVFADFAFGNVSLRADVGLYNPSMTTRVEPGQVLIQRLRVGYADFFAHAAFAKFVLEENRDESGGRVLALDDQVDIGLGYETKRARVLVEGFRAGDTALDEPLHNVAVSGAYIFGDPQKIGWQPALTYDWIENGGGVDPTHRFQAQFNVLWQGTNLVTGVNFQKTTSPVEETRGSLFVQGTL